MAAARTVLLLLGCASVAWCDDGCWSSFREATTEECPGEFDTVYACDSDGLSVGDLCESDGECGLSTSLEARRLSSPELPRRTLDVLSLWLDTSMAHAQGIAPGSRRPRAPGDAAPTGPVKSGSLGRLGSFVK